MKNIVTLLLLSTVCLGAQTTPDTNQPPVPPPGTVGPREERLREALRQALTGRTNAAANVLSSNAPIDTATQPPGAAAPAVTPNPAVTPGAAPQTNLPPRRSIIAPTTSPGEAGGPLSPIPPGATLIPPPPGTTNIPPEELLPKGLIDFRGADLNQVLGVYAELVNRTILRAATLPEPKIVLKTQTPLTKREAIQALDAVLGINGIAMVNIGEKFVKADQLAVAGTAGAEFNTVAGDRLATFGPYLTHVTQLKYVKPSEMLPVLQPFAKIPNSILPIDGSMILVLRDFTENVKRMLELIKEIDVAVPSEFVSEVIPIKYALASEIAAALNSLSTGGGGATVGGGAAGGTGGGRTGGAFGSRSGMGTGAGGSGFGRPGFGTGSQYPGSAQGAVNPIGGGGVNPGGGASFTDRLQNIIRKASVSGEIQVLGQTKIIADERSNSLLIYASREDMKTIKDIIGKLDVVLAQVLIEAVIIQVTLGDSKDFAMSYLQRQQSESGNFRGAGLINNTKGFFPGLGDLTGGTNNVTGGFSYLMQLGGNTNLDIVIRAVQSSSNARVLQRPRIQTSHAVQAQLFVGQSRPYPTASYYGGGGYGGYSSIQQLQIGVTLDVTPLINTEGLVVMDIHQTIENVDGEVQIDNVGSVPITSRKEAAAKVAVHDKDTIMLGGLIEDDNSKSVSGVPILMNLPLLGPLFRSNSSTKNRAELIVLIRPTVLPTPEIAGRVANLEQSKMPAVKRARQQLDRDEKKLMEANDLEEQNDRNENKK